VRPLLCTTLLWLFGHGAALAQNSKFEADPAQSRVTFSVDSTLHQVHGTFHLERGVVEFDPRGTQISGLIVVAAGSGVSGDEKRDRHMTSDILEATKFAEVTFSPKHLTGEIALIGDSTTQVNGVLTLHGSPHDLTVPLQVHIDGNTCTAKTQFAIPYVHWGMKDPSTFILRADKEVRMEITLVGQLSTIRQQ
jgi:polyisoprenoid-binding protein YceI